MSGPYAGSVQNVASPPSSLLSDTASINGRLREAVDRLVKIGDQLHGSQPRDAGASQVGKPEPVPTLRRNVDLIAELIGDLENEISRVGNRI